MPDNPESRREPLAFPAFDPVSATPMTVQLSYDKLKSLTRLGRGKVMEAGYIVPVVLARPTAVFEGFRSDRDEPRRGAGWRCYVGKPGFDFEDNGTKVPAREAFVFLVFVNDELVAYNWRWERPAPHSDLFPEDHAVRFVRNLL